MAGVGFVLRKLSERDDYAHNIAAYFYSAMVSSGPWLFTVLCLGMLVLVGNQYMSSSEIAEFRIVIIYNFSFSLIFSAPVFFVATRYLADMIYMQDVSGAPGTLLGMLVFTYGLSLPIVIAFYLFYAQIETWIALVSIMNYLLITGIWLSSIFLSALKEYVSIARSFALGMFVALVAAVILSRNYSVLGMLCGFSIGLALILFDLIARILAEYPGELSRPMAFLRYFRTHWELALCGLLYNMAVWVDKWILWGAPESTLQENGLISYPHYDGAMFLAYLSIVPAIALFTVRVETTFYERYLHFYQDIKNHATYEKIAANLKLLYQSVMESARKVVILQITIAIFCIAVAPALLSWLQASSMQLGMFRFGVLGVTFQSFTMFLFALLSYFDARLKLLSISLIFFLTNAVFSGISLKLGITWYGWGYAFSSIFSFTFAYIIFTRHIKTLPYQTFVGNNPGLR